MSSEFPFEPDAARGRWIAERLDVSPGGEGSGEAPISEALGGAIPHGFAALVRVLHPFARDRVVGGTFAELNEQAEQGALMQEPELAEEKDITWARVAAVHGAQFTADALSYKLLGLNYGEHSDVESADGWRYRQPEEGSLPASVLGRVAAVLTRHTSTPDRGVAAVWDGWGGLLTASSIGFFIMGAPSPRLPTLLQRPAQLLRRARFDFAERRRRFGTRSALLTLLSPRGQASIGTGILPKEAAKGPRLELPARSYVCFEAGIQDFVSSDGASAGVSGRAAWPHRAPWIDDPSGWWLQSPNLIWPDGQEWMLLTEIDFDSTLIACSRDCADTLLAAEGIEAVEITRDTPLWHVS